MSDYHSRTDSTATLHGAATGTPDGGAALHFDGTSGYVDAGYSEELDLAASVSVSAFGYQQEVTFFITFFHSARKATPFPSTGDISL